MKRHLCKLLALGLVATLLATLNFSNPASAAGDSDVQSITNESSKIEIYLNRSQLMSSIGKPVLIKGAILFPVVDIVARGLATYDETSQVIKVNNLVSAGRIRVGSGVGYVNGKKIVYAAGVQRIDKQIYVPMRFLSDALGGILTYDREHHSANVTYPEFVREDNAAFGYFLDGMSGILYKRDGDGRIRRLGKSTAKLEAGYIAGTQMTVTKVAEDTDLITINHSHGDPSSNVEIYTLFVAKGKILRQSHAHYWEYLPEDVKLYKDNAVMNDGHVVRLIGADGTVKSSWNVSKLAGKPKGNYAVEAIGEDFIVARWSEEGILTLIDLITGKATILFEEFGIDIKEIWGYFRYDGIRFSGSDEDQTELTFSFTNKDEQVKTYTYKLGDS